MFLRRTPLPKDGRIHVSTEGDPKAHEVVKLTTRRLRSPEGQLSCVSKDTSTHSW